MHEAEPGGEHVFPCRVYYEDTDAGGVVYHANYLKFAERARSELLRHFGTDNTTLLDRYSVVFAVRDCTVTYYRPARLDDALEVHTRILRVGAATLAARQRVMRSGEMLADLNIRLACLNPLGRPVRLPAEIRSALEASDIVVLGKVGLADTCDGTKYS